MSKQHPVECAGFPFPVLAAYPTKKADYVYNMTKAIEEQFKNYVKAEPNLVGFSTKRQNFQWVIPYHAGAVRYWKEKGGVDRRGRGAQPNADQAPERTRCRVGKACLAFGGRTQGQVARSAQGGAAGGWLLTSSPDIRRYFAGRVGESGAPLFARNKTL